MTWITLPVSARSTASGSAGTPNCGGAACTGPIALPSSRLSAATPSASTAGPAHDLGGPAPTAVARMIAVRQTCFYGRCVDEFPPDAVGLAVSRPGDEVAGLIKSDNPVGSADRSYIASSMHSMRCCKLLDLPITSDRSKPILLQDQQILASARHVIVKLEERAKYPDHLTPRLEHVPARAAQLCRE